MTSFWFTKEFSGADYFNLTISIKPSFGCSIVQTTLSSKRLQLSIFLKVALTVVPVENKDSFPILQTWKSFPSIRRYVPVQSLTTVIVLFVSLLQENNVSRTATVVIESDFFMISYFVFWITIVSLKYCLCGYLLIY